jgi:hypothetical protein
VVVGIVNRGAVAAENLTVRVSDDGRTLARVDAGAADVAGIVVTGTTVNSSVRDVSVAVTGSSPGGTANEPNASGRTVTATDPSVTVARPDLAVASVDRTVRADAVRYDATVVNAGTAPVSNATVALTSGNRTVTTAAVASLPPDGTASVALTAPADDVPGGVVTRVAVDAPGPADLNASNDAVRVTAPLPDLFVPGDGVRTVTSGGTCGETTASGGELVCALVGNRGAAPTTATVTVESTNRTVTRRTSLPGSGAEATTFTAVAVPVAALNVSDGERVTVSARADGFDARPSDNVGTSVVQTTVATDTPFPSGVPGVSGSTPPTDTDGDRRLEDVTGDGRFDFFDVIEFLFALDSLSDEPLTERQRTALDHDGDGSLTFFDVIDLLFQL